jgi:hypothetical protein
MSPKIEGKYDMANADMMQLEGCLKGMKFPMTKDELMEQVQKQGIDEQMLKMMSQMPNHHFRSSQEVMRALSMLQNGKQAKSH